LNSRKSPMARKISLSEDSRFERAVSAVADAFAAVVILEKDSLIDHEASLYGARVAISTLHQDKSRKRAANLF